MVISVKVCSGRTAFEVSTNIRIDLVKTSSLIKSRVATKHIVLLDHKGVEVSLYPSGRMLIKAKTKEESIEIAKDLLKELGIFVN
jgi:aspartate/methionine/tyrosine aminotransferase